jgi:hypothetical protein
MKTVKQSSLTSRNPIVSVFAVALVLLASTALWAQSQQTPGSREAKLDAGNLRVFVEFAKSDLKIQKGIILAQNMDLTETEGAEFWPLERDYQLELNKLNDQRLAIVQNYASNYETMTDKKATELAKRSFDREEKRTELKRKYFKKMEKVMPAKKVARFFQLDNQLHMAADLHVAAALPLIK